MARCLAWVYWLACPAWYISAALMPKPTIIINDRSNTDYRDVGGADIGAKRLAELDPHVVQVLCFYVHDLSSVTATSLALSKIHSTSSPSLGPLAASFGSTSPGHGNAVQC